MILEQIHLRDIISRADQSSVADDPKEDSSTLPPPHSPDELSGGAVGLAELLFPRKTTPSSSHSVELERPPKPPLAAISEWTDQPQEIRFEVSSPQQEVSASPHHENPAPSSEPLRAAFESNKPVSGELASAVLPQYDALIPYTEELARPPKPPLDAIPELPDQSQEARSEVPSPQLEVSPTPPDENLTPSSEPLNAVSASTGPVRKDSAVAVLPQRDALIPSTSGDWDEIDFSKLQEEFNATQ